MMTEFANLQISRQHQDKVIDACCGSGGFLIEALTVMRNKVRTNPSLTSEEKNELIEAIANNCIFGIDYGQDPPLARIARINMYLHGDGGSRIYYADALDKEMDGTTQTDPEVVQNLAELHEALDNDQFDVVLTNPPFSMTKEAKNPSELRILEQYELARQSKRSGALRASLRSSIMFLERYFDILKPGGKLITVIDDTLLSSGRFAYVRDFIRSHFVIRAIISLPGDTFKRSGSRVKTSVLVLEKKRSKSEVQASLFYYFAEYLGVDDLTPKASEHDVKRARQSADEETAEIMAEYTKYLNGEAITNILDKSHIEDRLDLRNCVPLFGRMVPKWRAKASTLSD